MSSKTHQGKNLFHCDGLNIISDTQDGEVQCLWCACVMLQLAV